MTRPTKWWISSHMRIQSLSLCDCRPPTDCIKQGLMHWIQIFLASLCIKAILFSPEGRELHIKLVSWQRSSCYFFFIIIILGEKRVNMTGNLIRNSDIHFITPYPTFITDHFLQIFMNNQLFNPSYLCLLSFIRLFSSSFATSKLSVH